MASQLFDDREAGERIFFIHLMKTGGTSFRQILWRLFDQEHIYPNQKDLEANGDQYPELEELVRLDESRRQSIRLLSGHYPFIARELLVPAPRCVVFFRDPFDRSVSLLRHAKRVVAAFEGESLASIFEHPDVRRFLKNYQTKQFSHYSLDEGLPWGGPDVEDAQRLELAKQNVLSCSFVGLTECFETSVRLFEKIFACRVGAAPYENRGGGTEPEIDDGLARRIRAEIELDVELYAFARDVVFSSLCNRYEIEASTE